MTDFSILERIVAENEETAERVRSKVYGTIILSKEKLTLQTSFDNATTQALGNYVAGTLVSLANNAVRDIDPSDDLQFLRIYTKKGEWMVSPDKEFIIIVQQT